MLSLMSPIRLSFRLSFPFVSVDNVFKEMKNSARLKLPRFLRSCRDFKTKCRYFFLTKLLTFSIIVYIKKHFIPLYMDRVHLSQGYGATTGRRFTFLTTVHPGIHLIDLGRIKSWVGLWATQRFWTRLSTRKPVP